MLGEGGFGKVYKGWLEEKVTSKNGSGSVVAIKKLDSESMQGFDEWQVIQPGPIQTEWFSKISKLSFHLKFLGIYLFALILGEFKKFALSLCHPSLRCYV